jgi:hypothetical protein
MKTKKNIEKLISLADTVDLDDKDALFTPSDKVWANVSQQLPTKRKRRPIVPILFLLALTGLFAFYLMSNSGGKTAQIDSDVNKDELQKNNEIKLASFSEPAFEQTKTISSKNLSSSSSISSNQISAIESEKSIKTIIPTITTPKSKLNSDNREIGTNNHGNKSLPSNSNIATNLEFPTKTETSITSIEDQTSSSQPKTISSETTIEQPKIEKSDENVTARMFSTFNPIERLDFKKLHFDEKITSLTLNKIYPDVKSSNKWLYGISASINPIKYSKPNINDPLEGTIKSSTYDKEYQFSLTSNYQLSNKLFLSFSPGIRYDELNTNYDLNIAYDYNTEKAIDNNKENYFSHSLPTDLGNFKTDMVVTRLADSPVLHNENINIDLSVNYKVYSLISPIGLHYAFNNISKGFHVGARFVPQFNISRAISVDQYQSKHTYVKGDHVNITKENNYKNLLLGSNVQLGYRMSLSNLGIVDFNITYHKNLSNEGRPNEVNIGMSLLKSF